MEFNLAQVFAAVAAANPDRDCIVFGDRRFSFAQTDERARRFARALHAWGLGAHRERSELAPYESGQSHLGLYMANCNEFLEAMLGAYQARVAPFNVNYRYVADELVYLLDNAGADALMYHARFAPTLALALQQLPPMRLIHVDDQSGNDPLPGAVRYEDLLASSGVRLAAARRAVAGRPLCALHRRYHRDAQGGAVAPERHLHERHGRADLRHQRGGDQPARDRRAVAAGGAGFDDGGTAHARRGAVGGVHQPVWRTAVRDGADDHALRSGGSVGTGQPGTRRFVVHRRRCLRPATARRARVGRPDYDLSGLLVLVTGGAALSAPIKQRFVELLPHLTIMDTGGSSESGAQMGQISGRMQRASGRFAPNPGAVVVSADMTRILSPGDDEIGWLAQQGLIPLGYLGDPEKTARTFPVVEGIRHSVPGDRARWDADGQIELLGRDAVTINSGGEKIFAEEVEAAIAEHPAVYDVVVTGRPSVRWGNEVVAIVQLIDGQPVDAESIIAEAARHIARYKLPKDVIFCDRVQRSPSGKADYRWAKAQVAEGL